MTEPQSGVEPSTPPPRPDSGPASPPPATSSAPTSGAPAPTSRALRPTPGVPGPISGVPGPAGRKRRSSLLPLLIFAIAGFVLAGAATAVYFYDQATQPDRSTPTVTVDKFLKVTLIDHSGNAANEFVCDDWTGAEGLAAMEAAVDPDVVRVTWDAPELVRNDEDSAQVQVRLRFRYPDDISPSGERHWVFDLVEQDGWRVCGARPLLQPN